MILRPVNLISGAFGTIIILLFISCHKKHEPVTCETDKGLYTFSKFAIGCAVNTDSLNKGGIYNQIATSQFNSITAENIFKPSFLHPGKDEYAWDKADELWGYCDYHHKRLHGHTLIWHEQLPRWMNNFSGSRDEWEEMFRDHIQTIVWHFKGRVKSWDVVNEAFNEDGTLRSTLWKEHIGDDYIEKAFRYAHEADPGALLFYNDYLLEMNPTKRRAVLLYLNAMKERGATVHGIGMQMHVNIYFPEPSQVVEAFKEVSANGYLLHLSELDISVNPFYSDIEPSADLFNSQAITLQKIVEHYKQVPANLQYGITFWGFSDHDSWIPRYFKRKDYPTIYDSDYQPKPAYCKLKECL